MSRQIDLSKCEDAFVNLLRVGEMWFQGVMLYVKKRKPEVVLNVSVSGNNILLTAQFVDYEHRYRYADERRYSSSISTTHGIVYASTQFQSASAITGSGMNRINFSSYSDDGTFSYSLEPSKYGSRNKRNWFKAWIAYIDPETGKNKIVYSPVINTTYNELLESGSVEV